MGIRFIISNFATTFFFFLLGFSQLGMPPFWLNRACSQGHIKTLEALSTKNIIAEVVVHRRFYVIIKNTKK